MTSILPCPFTCRHPSCITTFRAIFHSPFTTRRYDTFSWRVAYVLYLLMLSICYGHSSLPYIFFLILPLSLSAAVTAYNLTHRYTHVSWSLSHSRFSILELPNVEGRRAKHVHMCHLKQERKRRREIVTNQPSSMHSLQDDTELK